MKQVRNETTSRVQRIPLHRATATATAFHVVTVHSDVIACNTGNTSVAPPQRARRQRVCLRTVKVAGVNKMRSTIFWLVRPKQPAPAAKRYESRDPNSGSAAHRRRAARRYSSTPHSTSLGATYHNLTRMTCVVDAEIIKRAALTAPAAATTLEHIMSAATCYKTSAFHSRPYSRYPRW